MSMIIFASVRRRPNLHQLQHQRSMIQLFDIFRKEKRRERREALKEEIQRGYFDDFRQFRDTKGKIFHSTDKLVSSAAAPLFPAISTTSPDGLSLSLPLASPVKNVITLTCIAFRAGAQDMIEQWATPFSAAFSDHSKLVNIVELALVESSVMSMWPFKGILLKEAGKTVRPYQVPVHMLSHFGDADPIRKTLGLTNRLTAYVYLIDRDGKIRWRGSGHPEEQEVRILIQCGQELLGESLGEV